MPITSAKINTPASLRSELIAIRSESLIDIAGIATRSPVPAEPAQLLGQTVCAVVYDSDISSDADPAFGSLKGATLGITAFEVTAVNENPSGGSNLPLITVSLLPADEVCAPQQQCPCWTKDEINGLRQVGVNDDSECDNNSEVRFTFKDTDSFPAAYTVLARAGIDSSGDLSCQFLDFVCTTGGCSGIFGLRTLVDNDEAAVCQAQVAKAGRNRGFDCFPPDP